MIKEGVKKVIAHEKPLWGLVASSKSKTFLAFCFCFIIGAGVASLFDWPTHPYPAQAGIGAVMASFYFYIFIFLILFFLIIFWSNRFARFLILNSLFLILGIWRFTVTIPNCADPTILCNYNGRKITVTGWVSAEPDRRIDGARYTVSVASVAGVGARYILPQQPTTTIGAIHELPLQPVNGKVLISTKLYPEYHYGDTLTITCRVELPKNSEAGTFRYDKYLARYGVWSVCNNPTVELAKPNPALPSAEERRRNPSAAEEGSASRPGEDSPQRYLMTKIFALKTIVQNHIDRLWHEPESSFMAGILFGSKSGLPQELMDNFSKTGVTHIIAVSGFNVTIIVVALMFVLIRFGLYRQQAFWVITVFIIVFVLFTGATASVLRAGVMGMLVLIAKQLGRMSRITNVLIFAAAVMLLGNPYLLVWDAGFQLSFLATMGLVYVSPVLQRVITSPDNSAGRSNPMEFKKEPGGASNGIATLITFARNDAVQGIMEPLVQTLSAIIATLPLILYQFGRLSVVAPLVNVLVLWIISWLMLGGFVTLVLSFAYYPVAQVLAWITGLGLKYVLFVVEFFGNRTWSSANWHLPLWGMVFMYAVLVFGLHKLKKKNEKIKNVI